VYKTGALPIELRQQGPFLRETRTIAGPEMSVKPRAHAELRSLATATRYLVSLPPCDRFDSGCDLPVSSTAYPPFCSLWRVLDQHVSPSQLLPDPISRREVALSSRRLSSLESLLDPRLKRG